MADDDPMTQQEQLKDDGTEPYGKFRVAKQTLCSIAYMCQERVFAEEVDKLEEIGEKLIEEGLCTDFKQGLTMQDQAERERAFGHNRKPKIEPKGYCELWLGALNDFTMKVLCVAAVISIIVDVTTADESYRQIAWIEGFAILVAVIISTNANAVNDYQKERQFQKLNEVADERKRVTVVRNGKKCDIHMSEVLVGDVVQIFEGMEIPADGFVLEASDLTSDESAMTGETDPIKKNVLSECINKRNQLKEEGAQNTAGHHDVPSPIMMSGTRVLSGEGKMLILVVGDSSCAGKIAALLRQDEPEATPLQMKLTAIAEDIGKFGLISAILIVCVMCLRFGIERGINDDWENYMVVTIIGYFIIGITVVVVAIPEGLPLAVTLSLAYSTKQMLQDQNLVRKMAACETMGGASMICSDKTGTLTQNKMSLVNVWNDDIIEIDTYSEKQQLTSYFPQNFQEFFIQCAVVNGSAMLRPEPKGSKTEIALLEFIERCSMNYEEQREKYPASTKFPFSSQRKRMSMVLELDGGRRRLVCKGASEMVLAACSQYHSKGNGSIVPMNQELKQKVEKSIETMAGRALRTICLAYKEISAREDLTTKDNKGVYAVEQSDLTLVAVLGIKDILRQEVPRAIQLCRRAGIKVRMVTGDNKMTARAIAKECGIITPGDDQSIVMEGPDFIAKIGGVVCTKCRTAVCPCARDSTTAKKENKDVRVDTIANPQEFDKIYPHLDVLARSRPEDKYALVTGLIERGHVVAVTGDGTNDAPALKKADVGFAMGIAGTEVAREAAAIILLDDNFNSIVKAVMWGRNVYDNIKKFLRFQLTANLVSVGLTLIGAAVLSQEILKPIQLLWVNLIMDTLGSLALATEPPTEKLLYRKPHDRNEYIISKKMFKFIVGTAIIQIAVVLIIVFAGDSFLPEYPDEYDLTAFRGIKKRYKYSDHLCKTTYDELKKYSEESGRPLTLIPDITESRDVKKDGTCLSSECVCHEKKCYEIMCEECDFETSCTIIASGRLNTPEGGRDYAVFFEDSHEPSRHFTYVFNVFIMLQLFNFLNSRRFNDEINIFEGLSKHSAFMIIVPVIFCIQILMVTFGSKAIGLYGNFGLKIQQWLIGIGFGCISIIGCFFLKFIKEDMCCECGSKEINPMETEHKIIALKGDHSSGGLARRYSSLRHDQNPFGAAHQQHQH
ncbi:unnamed protein product [Paramecium primaurelia]|uniref:P-type sodium-transporting ATPase4 n=1 Tax=Paramecium primaurelia TaxID=5886 RepID=A0A8S1MVY1_PARPR|nr:unnamed protein product [Paramecium primaurelia]